MSLIYLAGPITGGTYDGVTEWRDYVKEKIEVINESAKSRHAITCLSPMRHKDYLLGVTYIDDEYKEKVMSSQRGITARDRFDATRCDVLFVNLLGAERVSIGTVMEIAWADANRIPIILVIEPNGNLHDHAMIREVCPFRVDNIDEAIQVAAKILLP